jgi:DNA-binding CsgD family transcriptional regulator
MPAHAVSSSRKRRSTISSGPSRRWRRAGSTWIPAEGARQSPKVTQREREVLRLLADGLRNEEIGKRLFISPETVRTHVRKAMAKLEADTRTQAVAEAIRQRLIA